MTDSSWSFCLMRSIQKIAKKYHAENVSNFSVSSSCKIQNLTDINAYTLHVSGSGCLFVIKSTLALTYSALYLGSSKLLDLVIYSLIEPWLDVNCIFFKVLSISLYILGINATATGESYQLGLVATTASGVRLYFTTADNNTSNLRPHNLTLQHVRLPPGFSGSSQSGRPSKVHMSYYQNGNFFIFFVHKFRYSYFGLSLKWF